MSDRNSNEGVIMVNVLRISNTVLEQYSPYVEYLVQVGTAHCTVIKTNK